MESERESKEDDDHSRYFLARLWDLRAKILLLLDSIHSFLPFFISFIHFFRAHAIAVGTASNESRVQNFSRPNL